MRSSRRTIFSIDSIADPSAAVALQLLWHCAFDLLEETLRITNLGTLVAGSSVNLERAMRADTRFSGHFVQGHVDATLEVLRYEAHGADHQFTIALPSAYRNLVAHKGSVCLDGISLTIAELTAATITAWITPHTHQVTTLRTMQAGPRVNVEFDMLAKYLDRMLAARLEAPSLTPA